MAVANTKSTIITALDAHTGAQPKNRIHGGAVCESVAKVEVAAADDIGSVYRFFRLPWNARIGDLRIACDAITTLTLDIGVYRTADDGGAVVDADEFASAQACTSALNVWTDVLGEAAVATKVLADRAEMELWELLDEATEPIGRFFDICGTAVGEPGSAGTVALKIQYVAG